MSNDTASTNYCFKCKNLCHKSCSLHFAVNAPTKREERQFASHFICRGCFSKYDVYDDFEVDVFTKLHSTLARGSDSFTFTEFQKNMRVLIQSIVNSKHTNHSMALHQKLEKEYLRRPQYFSATDSNRSAAASAQIAPSLSRSENVTTLEKNAVTLAVKFSPVVTQISSKDSVGDISSKPPAAALAASSGVGPSFDLIRSAISPNVDNSVNVSTISSAAALVTASTGTPSSDLMSSAHSLNADDSINVSPARSAAKLASASTKAPSSDPMSSAHFLNADDNTNLSLPQLHAALATNSDKGPSFNSIESAISPNADNSVNVSTISSAAALVTASTGTPSSDPMSSAHSLNADDSIDVSGAVSAAVLPTFSTGAPPFEPMSQDYSANAADGVDAAEDDAPDYSSNLADNIDKVSEMEVDNVKVGTESESSDIEQDNSSTAAVVSVNFAPNGSEERAAREREETAGIQVCQNQRQAKLVIGDQVNFDSEPVKTFAAASSVTNICQPLVDTAREPEPVQLKIIDSKFVDGEWRYLVRENGVVADDWFRYDPIDRDLAEAIDTFNSEVSMANASAAALRSRPTSTTARQKRKAQAAFGDQGSSSVTGVTLRTSTRQRDSSSNRPLEVSQEDIQNLASDSEGSEASVQAPKKSKVQQQETFSRSDPQSFFSVSLESLVYEILDPESNSEDKIEVLISLHSPNAVGYCGEKKMIELFAGSPKQIFQPCEPVWGGRIKFSPVCVETRIATRGKNTYDQSKTEPDWRFFIGFGQRLLIDMDDPLQYFIVGFTYLSGKIRHTKHALVYIHIENEARLVSVLGKKKAYEVQELKAFPLRRILISQLFSSHVPKVIDTVLDSTNLDLKTNFFRCVRTLFSPKGELPKSFYFLTKKAVGFSFLCSQCLTVFHTDIEYKKCCERVVFGEGLTVFASSASK